MSPTIFITTLLVFFIYFFFSRRMNKRMNHVGEVAFSGFALGVIIWASIGLFNHPESKEYKNPKRQLVALKDGMGMTGSFFLGSGTFKGKMRYYGYEFFGEKSFKMVNFPNSSIIVEDITDGEEPYFIETRKKCNIDSVKYKKWMIGPFEFDTFIEWEIHIPPGTILKDKYELDLD
jgi:hypothetical protein